MSAPDILCIGALHWDVIGRCGGRLGAGDDRPGRVIRRPGGVAFNIARALLREGMRPILLAAIGDDAEGAALAAACAAAGLDPDFLHRGAGPTDSYVALEDGSGLVGAIADAGTLEAAGAALLAPLDSGRLPSPWAGPLVLDGNLPAGVLDGTASDPRFAMADLRVVAASNAKAGRLVPLAARPGATLYLNCAEAAALAGRGFNDAAEAAAALSGAGRARFLVTDGPRMAALSGPAGVLRRSPPAVAAQSITGAGDRLVAAHVAAEARGLGPAAALEAALTAAAAHVGGKAPA